MIPVDTLYLFFASAVALALVPGPDNIFVLTQSVLYGWRSGLLVTLGLCTGIMVHTAAVAFGVAAIFLASATAFTSLKVIGAGYLLYLALCALRAEPMPIEGEGLRLSSGKLFGRGIVMNITNPKVTVFFLAYLPQFTDPDFGSLHGQMMTLGALFIVATLMIFGSIAWFAGLLSEFLRGSNRTQRVINWIVAIIFICLAIRLLMVTH
ncbi:MAG: threonine transporter RhtB [Magnetovibrio sp.]|nr:threonine transporter RhtB [Magnetovibrio sp.]|tara:strand:- start:818 stop:1441 length:624 start_codon:yes stop_codon:yes gene_type:complete